MAEAVGACCCAGGCCCCRWRSGLLLLAHLCWALGDLDVTCCGRHDNRQRALVGSVCLLPVSQAVPAGGWPRGSPLAC